MSRFFIPRHHKTHEKGGSDEMDLGAFGVSFGPPHQTIPLPSLVVANGDDNSGMTWTQDNTYTGGGYLGSTSNTAYFTFLALLAPFGSIFGLRARFAGGPDFGIVKIEAKSLQWEPAARPSGDPSGKIEAASYGSSSYVTLTSSIDNYSAAPAESSGNINGSLVMVVGGDVGDPLTTFASSTDPYTGFAIMDGGPGWYKFKFSVNGQNASATGFKMRVTSLAVMREDDDGYA